jgi:hypothetical protein
MPDLLKKFNPNRLNKMTPAQLAQLRQEMFLALKPLDRLRHSEGLAKQIWGPKYRYQSLKGLKVVKKKISL